MKTVMKTAMLKKKLGKLFNRANEEDQAAALQILNADPKKPNLFNAAMNAAERNVLDQVLMVLESYAGPTQTDPKSIEERAFEWWKKHLDGLRANHGHTAWFGLVEELTQVDNFGYQQGQIRPDVRLGRFDVYYTIVGHGYHGFAAKLAGLTYGEIRLQEEMDAYGVVTENQLQAAKRLDKMMRQIDPDLLFNALNAMGNPIVWRMFISRLSMHQAGQLIQLFEANRQEAHG
ncbi:MAG: hypothetical protein ACOZAO_00345 [Patescibacteria group bacterium]